MSAIATSSLPGYGTDDDLTAQVRPSGPQVNLQPVTANPLSQLLQAIGGQFTPAPPAPSGSPSPAGALIGAAATGALPVQPSQGIQNSGWNPAPLDPTLNEIKQVRSGSQALGQQQRATQVENAAAQEQQLANQFHAAAAQSTKAYDTGGAGYAPPGIGLTNMPHTADPATVLATQRASDQLFLNPAQARYAQYIDDRPPLVAALTDGTNVALPAHRIVSIPARGQATPEQLAAMPAALRDAYLARETEYAQPGTGQFRDKQSGWHGDMHVGYRVPKGDFDTVEEATNFQKGLQQATDEANTQKRADRVAKATAQQQALAQQSGGLNPILQALRDPGFQQFASANPTDAWRMLDVVAKSDELQRHDALTRWSNEGHWKNALDVAKTHYEGLTNKSQQVIADDDDQKLIDSLDQQIALAQKMGKPQSEIEALNSQKLATWQRIAARHQSKAGGPPPAPLPPPKPTIWDPPPAGVTPQQPPPGLWDLIQFFGRAGSLPALPM